MSEKKKFSKMITPKGQSKSAFLAEPNTKYSPEGDYQITLLLPAGSIEAKQLMAEMDQICEEAVEEIAEELEPAARKKMVKVAPYKPEFDQEGEETGNLEFRFKQKALVTNKKTGKIIQFKPLVFNSRKAPVPTEGLVVGDGSTVRVSYTPRGYYVGSSGSAGISLTLNAVQIIKLVKPDANAGSLSPDDEGDDSFIASLLKTAKSHNGSEEDSQ